MQQIPLIQLPLGGGLSRSLVPCCRGNLHLQFVYHGKKKVLGEGSEKVQLRRPLMTTTHDEVYPDWSDTSLGKEPPSRYLLTGPSPMGPDQVQP